MISALVTFLLLLIVVAGSTALVLVAIMVSLEPPELEERHDRRPAESDPRWQRAQARAGTPGMARVLHRVAHSPRLQARGRDR